jgi:hypothetical protein
LEFADGVSLCADDETAPRCGEVNRSRKAIMNGRNERARSFKAVLTRVTYESGRENPLRNANRPQTPGLISDISSSQVFAFAFLIHQSVWLVSGMKENKETKVFKNGDAVINAH